MAVQPYVFFDGRCEEAIEFYKKALDAKVSMLMRYGESPEKGNMPPGSDNKIMHGNITVAGSTILVADGHCGGKPVFEGFGLSLTVPSEEEAEKRFAALADGGRVLQPLIRTFFSPRFGMVADKFGVMWLVHVAP